MNDASKNWHPKTHLVRGGLTRSSHGETSEALVLSSGFVYETAESVRDRFLGEEEGFIYSRYNNPTVAMFEERMRSLEGSEVAVATASGMSAVMAALACSLKQGDHIVAARALFGSCSHIITHILPGWGVEYTLVDGPNLDDWAAAMRPNTKMAFLESPANPTLELVDIAGVAAIVHAHGAKLIVDNVFSTPVLQRPLSLGADIVVYSATKHIDGQGRVLGGIVLCDQEFYDVYLQTYLRHTGPTMSAFNAWLLLKGLETLDLRVEQQCTNAEAVADFLGAQPQVSRVLYPGREDFPQRELARRQMDRGSTLICFFVEGGQPAAFALLNALSLIDISNNLGDTKSLITHPTTTTHSRLTPQEREDIGITDGCLRLSVGLEDHRDLIADLAQALAAI
jgi:O-succinylhomoserine sulfhydrylase